MFVHIDHIDDVLPHISLADGFRVLQRDGYQVVDYAFVDKDMFTNPYALECRGLKFDSLGNLIARPFHKFFNLGEKEFPQDIDFSAPHRVLEKRDGSMIHPCILGDDLVFMTRKGKTDHADLALAHATDGALDLCSNALSTGITPIFEFTSPLNRVVLGYETPELTLLAARHTHAGNYLTHDELGAMANEHGVSLVADFDPIVNISTFTSQARALEGAEGYVIVFDTGHRLKLKADAYVLRHKALDGLSYEKNVLAWIAQNAVDDVAPLLHDQAREFLLDYAGKVQASVQTHVAQIEAFYDANKDLPRKDFALKAQEEIDKRLTRVAFAMLDGREAQAEMMKIVHWATHSETRPAQIRDLLGTEWTPPDLSAVKD